MTKHEPTSRTAIDHEAQREHLHVGADYPHVHGHSAPSGHDSHPGPSGHGGHPGHGDHVQRFRRLFWVMLLLAVPVVALSPMFGMLLGYQVLAAGPLAWAPPVLGTVLYAWGGSPFLAGAAGELRDRRPGMMLLIGLAISVAFLASWGATLGLLSHTLEFWWELALLIVIMLLGHWLEMRSLAQTTSALDSLAALLPDVAEVVRGDEVEKVAPTGLVVGDVVLVRPGGSVPADGRIVEGEAELDESMVTGESRTVRRGPGDPVTAGTVSTDSGLRVQVTATGEDTTLAGIRRLVERAQSSTSRAQRLADRAAAWLFWFALSAATLTGIAWTLLGQPDQAVIRVITVLVIACPHALGLAVPLVVAISTALGARNGILVRDRLALESAREIDTVIFDKTGTLTKGDFGVVGRRSADGYDPDSALALTAAVEGDSEHIIARAIRQSAGEKGLTLPAIDSFEAIKGRGVRAANAGRAVHVGGPRLLELLGMSPDQTLSQFAAEAGDKGQTVVYLVDDGQVSAAFALADAIRAESRQAVDRLHELGIRIVMLTGDSSAVANAVAQELGIDSYFAEVLPEDKDQKVAALQGEGRKVAMVGDGVNDAPALTRADVGIAIGSGTDVAIESAGIILVKSNPLDVVKVFELSKASYRKMKENLIWATGYNVVAIPLAAGLLYPSFGILLSPALGALLMSLSTIIVAINAQTLRRLRMDRSRLDG